MKKALASMLALLGIHQHLTAEQKQDIASAAYHATPGAVTAGGFRLAGLPLSDWLVLASIAFVALQASYLIWKWRRDYLRAQTRQQLRERAQQGGAHEQQSPTLSCRSPSRAGLDAWRWR